MALNSFTKHKCFVSYHHEDEDEVQEFIEAFDHDQDVLTARGIGASMSGDIINSTDADYIMAKIREKYLRDTSVTIVLIGKCTWARKYVDWEIAASLRNTATINRNGLLAITLPSVAELAGRKLPPRLDDNVNGEDGYARWWKYPTSAQGLGSMIETAYGYRTSRASLAKNSRDLKSYNSSCE